jgi:hypothetical protein
MLEKVLEKNIKTSAKDNLGYQKLKHNKPWFGDKLQWLHIQPKSVERIFKI